MKRFLLLVLILAAFTQCLKDSLDSVPEIASIVGKWRVVEHRRISRDSVLNESITEANSWIYQFLSDGVILNGSGKQPCCLPSKFFFNGREFKPRPAKPVEPDPMCQYVQCAGCPELRITQNTADSLLIEYCPGTIITFVRDE